MFTGANYAEFINANQIQSGDTANEIRVQLLNRFGTPVNLQGAAVKWSLIQNFQLVVDEREAETFLDGEIRLQFQEGDNPKPGPAYLLFDVRWSDGTREMYPSNGNLMLKIS